MEIELTLKELVDRLQYLPQSAITNALDKGGLVVENNAKLNCPVGDSGQLRRSITHEVNGTECEIGTNVDYAPYVEYGTGIYAEAGNGRQDPWCYQDAKGQWHYTVGQAPQPFLRPALYDNVKEIESVMTKEIIKEWRRNIMK